MNNTVIERFWESVTFNNKHKYNETKNLKLPPVPPPINTYILCSGRQSENIMCKFGLEVLKIANLKFTPNKLWKQLSSINIINFNFIKMCENEINHFKKHIKFSIGFLLSEIYRSMKAADCGS